jgi:hypothetical protein
MIFVFRGVTLKAVPGCFSGIDIEYRASMHDATALRGNPFDVVLLPLALFGGRLFELVRL